MEILRAQSPARKVLDDLQLKIAMTSRMIDQITRARVPNDEARKVVRLSIERQLQKPDAASFGMFAIPPDVNAPRLLPEIDWSLLIALIGRQAVEDRICEAIEASSPAAGLPRAARQAKLAELSASLVELKRAEEREILRLEDAGHTVLRRADADVQLILEIWNETVPLTNAPAPRRPGDGPTKLGEVNKGLSVWHEPEAQKS